MDNCSNAGRGVLLAASGALFFAFTLWPLPAAAFHVKGIKLSVNSVNRAAGTVNVDVTETTGAPGGSVTDAGIQWGDAASSNKPWTAVSTTTTVGLQIFKYHKVSGVVHIYPDLTTRTITVTSDCCNSTLGYDFDTAVVDFGCSDAPQGGCNTTAAKAQLQIKNDSDNNKDKLKFKWLNGNTTFANAPTGTTQYFLCIYDPTLAVEAAIPAGAPWAAAGTGFKYKDTTGAAGGAQKIKLKPGTGNAKILFKGGGMPLSDPAMPLTQPVTVQVQNSAGECWEHQFTSPEIENSADAFKDKEP